MLTTTTQAFLDLLIFPSNKQNVFLHNCRTDHFNQEKWFGIFVQHFNNPILSLLISFFREHSRSGDGVCVCIFFRKPFAWSEGQLYINNQPFQNSMGETRRFIPCKQYGYKAKRKKNRSTFIFVCSWSLNIGYYQTNNVDYTFIYECVLFLSCSFSGVFK